MQFICLKLISNFFSRCRPFTSTFSFDSNMVYLTACLRTYYSSQGHRLNWFSLMFCSFNLDFSLQNIQSILASRFFCHLVLSFPAMLVKIISGFNIHTTVWKYAFSSSLSIFFTKIFVHFTVMKLFSKRNKWQETMDKQELVLVLP